MARMSRADRRATRVWSRQDQWVFRPDVWSGVLLGSAAVVESFWPSLMPRSTVHQAMVSGASAATGFAAGSASYGWGKTLARREGLPRIAALGANAAAAGAVLAFLRDREGERLWRPAMRAGAEAVVAGSVASAAVEFVRTAKHPVRAGAVLGAGAVTAGGVRVGFAIKAQLQHRDEYDGPPPKALPAVAQSVSVAAALAALVNGFRYSGDAAARLLSRRIGVPETPAKILGLAGATGVWIGIGTAFADTFVKGMELYNRVLDPGYDDPPTSAACSASAASPLSYARTGREGRRFIGDRPSADDIAEVTGRPAVAEPVRIYVGFDHAKHAPERVALALAELERTGAYDRSLLIVGCPPGNGWVNTIPFEVADYLLAGDSAGVAIQYERLPSLLSIQRARDGGHHLRLLLEGIRDALAERPTSRRPRVVVYGESLGAWAGQDAFLHKGTGGLDELGVDAALWVGTPFYSGWLREALAPGGAIEDGTAIEVDGIEQIEALAPAARERLRTVLLSHDNDPVRRINVDLLLREPPWLAESPRRPTVPREQHFIPMLTGYQTIVDTVNATNPVPGVFRATGHDYRLDLPAVTVAAYRLPEPDAAVADRLMAKLQADEAARAARFRLPKAEADGETVDADAAAASADAAADIDPLSMPAGPPSI